MEDQIRKCTDELDLFDSRPAAAYDATGHAVEHTEYPDGWRWWCACGAAGRAVSRLVAYRDAANHVRIATAAQQVDADMQQQADWL